MTLGLSRESFHQQPTEAARLDAAIARNLKEPGYGG